MNETILRLLTRPSEAGDDAILSGELAVPFFGPVFDRLLAKRVHVEQAPLADWEVCDACECALPCRPIRKAGDGYRAECPLDRRHDVDLTEDDLRVFRIGGNALASVIGAAAGFSVAPKLAAEKVWRLGDTPSGRAVFLALEPAALTQHVEMAFSGLKAPGSLEPFTKLEIEHILPDNPKAELRATWTAENPNAIYDDYKNRLGNLTLLEKPINIVAGNDFYAAKRVEYSKSGNYLTRSLVALTDVGQNTSISRINAKLTAFPTWNAASIEKRHGLLIALAQEVWKTTAIEV